MKNETPIQAETEVSSLIRLEIPKHKTMGHCPRCNMPTYWHKIGGVIDCGNDCKQRGLNLK